MMMGRVGVMLKLNPDLEIHVMCPYTNQCITAPEDLNKQLLSEYPGKVKFVKHEIIPNALATRYDFDYVGIAYSLFGVDSVKYDLVYLNDPMHLRNFKAMFYLKGGYTPKFVVHSHFIDDPECPKFPTEASLWMGQCEAARKADYNFWQCESAMNIFFEQFNKEYKTSILKEVKEKSMPWDDGYSSTEMSSYDESNIRFNIEDVYKLIDGKKMIFVPNRIGKEGVSSDYTNCGKFMFEHLPKFAKLMAEIGQEYVVFCGNPSQKISNQELEKECGPYGYVSLVPDAFNRDEFKFLASLAPISIGLYNQDSYGGTVARECVELGCQPLWTDMYEYKAIAEKSGWPKKYMCKSDLSDVPERLLDLVIDLSDDKLDDKPESPWKIRNKLIDVVKDRCSYENTTENAMKVMGLL
jgi:hypothetical protein